jgi:hypothetical protein
MKLVAQAKLNNAKLRAERTTPFFREAGMSKRFSVIVLEIPVVRSCNTEYHLISSETLFKQIKLDQIISSELTSEKEAGPKNKVQSLHC